MIVTIKELLLEWWGRNTTTRMPLPTIYTYEVEVDGKIVQIESTCASRTYAHFMARRKYPHAKRISVLRRIKNYSLV